MTHQRPLTLLIVFLAIVAQAAGCTQSPVPDDAASAPEAETPLPASTEGRSVCPTHWTKVPLSLSASRPTSLASPTGVDALSGTDAWVVGNTFVQGWRNGQRRPQGPPFALRWNGVEWAEAPLITPEGVDRLTLEDVVAIAPDEAWAVGDVVRGSGQTPQALRWDGNTWSPADTPAPPGPGSMSLRGVDAVSSNDAWAVGYSYRYGGSVSHTLIEHWDGQKWTVVPSPDVLPDNGLYDVSALSETDVWAVGDTSDREDQRPLILHWDGTIWSSVAVPSVPGWPLWLYGVEAVAVDDVWAVGFTTVGSAHEALILHWDGKRWSRVLDDVRPRARQIVAVSASSTSDVWAVGGFPSGNGITAGPALMQHWDGRGWERDAAPAIPASSGGLGDVVTLPDGETWAVGRANRLYAMHLCPDASP